MGHRFTYVVSPEEERENLTVEWFLRRHGYSRHIITGLKRTEDGIFRNGVRAWTSQAVHAGDVIETHLVETEPSDGILPRPVPFSVVYEDDDILVVDKPADTPIHPSIGNYENTLANGIAWYFEQKGEPFVYRCINRLDRDTTGLIVLAKHALSAAVLSQAMRSREIHRTYQAFALGETAASGTIDAPIARLNGSLIQRTVDFASGERSVTHYNWLPDAVGGILWFGVDDADMAVFTPIYCSVTASPECYRVGNGDMMNFSWTSAFWIHNWVANMAYGKYNYMIQDIRSVQQELENGYQQTIPAIDKAASELYAKNPAEAVKFLTWFSSTTADQATARWKKLGEYLLVKYMDGNVKKEENGQFKQNGYGLSEYPDFPGYDEDYYRSIVKSAGDKLKVK